MLAPMQALRLQSAPRVSRRSQSVRASAEAAPATAFSPPALDPNTPSPIFGGSTGGLLRKAQVRGGAATGVLAVRELGTPILQALSVPGLRLAA